MNSHESRQIISVTGEGDIQAAPDEAAVLLGAITEDPVPSHAQKDNAAVISRILQALKALGIPEEQIKTTDYRMEAQYDFSEGKNQFKGYKVQHMLEIATRNIGLTGSIIDAAVAAGANSIDRVRFSLADSKKMYQQALALAVKDAGEKAEAIAQPLNAAVYTVPVRIEELSEMGVPLFQTGVSAKAAASPIQPGQLTFSARIRADYQYE